MATHVTRQTWRLIKGLVFGFILSLTLLNIKRFSLTFDSRDGRDSVKLMYNTRSDIYVALLTTEETWENAEAINATWGSEVDHLDFYSRNEITNQQESPEYRLITGIPENNGDTSSVTLLRILEDICFRVAGSYRWYFISADDIYVDVTTIRRYLNSQDYNHKVVASQLSPGGSCMNDGLIVLSNQLLNEICKKPDICFDRSAEVIGCLQSYYKAKCSTSFSAGSGSGASSSGWMRRLKPSDQSMSAIHRALKTREATSTATRVLSRRKPLLNMKASTELSGWNVFEPKRRSPMCPKNSTESIRNIILYQTQSILGIYANSRTSQTKNVSTLNVYWNMKPSGLSVIATFKSKLSDQESSSVSRFHARRRFKIKHKQSECIGIDSWLVLYVTQPAELCGDFQNVWSQLKKSNKNIQLLVLTTYMLDEYHVRTGCMGAWLHELGPGSNDITFVETREIFVKLSNLESLANTYLKERYSEGETISMLLMSELYLQQHKKLASCYLVADCGKPDHFNNYILKTLPQPAEKVLHCVKHKLH